MNVIRAFSLAGVVTLGLTTAAAAAPKVTLSPTSGVPTSKTIVTISGFAASRAVDVYFDTTDRCLVATSATGTGSCTIKIPADAQPVVHWVSAVDRLSGNIVQSPYTVAVNWPQFHGLNASHDGFNRYENTISVNNAGQLDLLWTAVPTVQFSSSPVISSSRVFAFGRDNRLYGFNALTGASLPGFPKLLSGGLADYQNPVISGANVYVSTLGTGAQLSAFNIGTGAPLAGFPKAIGVGSYGGPTVVGNNIYAADTSGKIYGFNALTGAVLPNFPIIVAGNPYFSTPITYLNGRLYVGAANGKLYAFDAVAGGAPVASNVGGFDIGGPAASGGTIYIAPYYSRYMSRYSADLTVMWVSPVATVDTPDGTPAIANGVAVTSDNQGGVYAFGVGKGVLRWTQQLDNLAIGSPIIANGVVFVGSRFAIYALNAATGDILWSHAGGIWNNQSPAVVNGIVYVASINGGLRAFSANGLLPAVRRPGAPPPALTALKPDRTLKPQP